MPPFDKGSGWLVFVLGCAAGLVAAAGLVVVLIERGF
jgi:hypothetical protein